MRHFKKALLLSAFVFFSLLVAGAGALAWITNLEIPGEEKVARSEAAGFAVVALTCVVSAPFWIVAGLKFDKARRTQ